MWWQEQRRDGTLWRTLWPQNEDAMGDKTVAGRSSRRPRVACDPPRSASPVAAAVALGQRSLVAVYHLHTGSHASVHTLGNAAPGASQEHHKSVVSPVVDGSFSVRALPQPPSLPMCASTTGRSRVPTHNTFPAPRPPHQSYSHNPLYEQTPKQIAPFPSPVIPPYGNHSPISWLNPSFRTRTAHAIALKPSLHSQAADLDPTHPIHPTKLVTLYSKEGLAAKQNQILLAFANVRRNFPLRGQNR